MVDAAVVSRPSHIPANLMVDFDIYAPDGVKQDFHRAWKALQAPGVPDVVWTPRNGGHWIVNRNALMSEMLADYKNFSNTAQVIPKEAAGEVKLLPTLLNPPEHRPFRILLNSSLAPKAVSYLEDSIRQLAIDLIENFRTKGRCNFIREYAEILPIQIFLRLFDLPFSDAVKLKSWSDQMLRPPPDVDWGADKTGFQRGIRLFQEYLSPFVDQRMNGTGNDFLTRLVSGRIGDRPLTKDEALRLAVQVLIAGLDTVVNFLGFAMLHLARHPENRRELVADPSLIPVAVEELFRRYPVVVLVREVTQDMEFHGVAMKQGEMIAVPTPLGGIDDHAHERPMDVDFHRASVDHVTFSTGPHRCPGAHLARTEIRITLEEWLKRIPEFAVETESEVQFTGGIVAVVDALPLVWDPESTNKV